MISYKKCNSTKKYLISKIKRNVQKNILRKKTFLLKNNILPIILFSILLKIIKNSSILIYWLSISFKHFKILIKKYLNFIHKAMIISKKMKKNLNLNKNRKKILIYMKKTNNYQIKLKIISTIQYKNKKLKLNNNLMI